MTEPHSLFQALRQKVDAACPGPWWWRESGKTELWADPDQEIAYRLLDTAGRAVLNHAQTWQIRQQEADFIETFDPVMVAKLLDVVEAAEPLARLPLPVSSDERADWHFYRQKLKEAIESVG